MTRYEATCSVWFTEDGQRIYRFQKFEAQRLEGYSGISGTISSYIRYNFDKEPRVWKCPVIEVKKNGNHHGYYSSVNGSFRRLNWSYQGEDAFARKLRLKVSQNRGYSQLFSVFSDFHGENKKKYKERTGVCLDALSEKLHKSVSSKV